MSWTPSVGPSSDPYLLPYWSPFPWMTFSGHSAIQASTPGDRNSHVPTESQQPHCQLLQDGFFLMSLRRVMKMLPNWWEETTTGNVLLYKPYLERLLLPLKWPIMQTKWAGVHRPFERSNSSFTVLAFSSPPFLPLPPADLVIFFSVSLCVFYWHALRADVSSEAVLPADARRAAAQFLTPVFPLGDLAWTFAWSMHKSRGNTQTHSAGCTPTCGRVPAERNWKPYACMGGEPAGFLFIYLFFMFLIFLPFFSLQRKDKTRWCEAKTVCQLILLFDGI